MVLLLLGCLRFEELAASPQLPQVTGGPPRDSSMKIAMGRATCGWSAGRRDLKHTLKRPAFLQPAPAQADDLVCQKRPFQNTPFALKNGLRELKLGKAWSSKHRSIWSYPQELVDFPFTGTGCIWKEFQGFPSLPP